MISLGTYPPSVWCQLHSPTRPLRQVHNPQSRRHLSWARVVVAWNCIASQQPSQIHIVQMLSPWHLSNHYLSKKFRCDRISARPFLEAIHIADRALGLVDLSSCLIEHFWLHFWSLWQLVWFFHFCTTWPLGSLGFCTATSLVAIWCRLYALDRFPHQWSFSLAPWFKMQIQVTVDILLSWNGSFKYSWSKPNRWIQI